MEATHSYETSINVYQTTRRHILDDCDLGRHWSENLSSNKCVRFQAVRLRRPGFNPSAVYVRFVAYGVPATGTSLPQRLLFTTSVILPSLFCLICGRPCMACLQTAVPNKPQYITNILQAMRSALFPDLAQRILAILYRRFGDNLSVHS